jgi:hypothetical protein
MGEPWLTLLGTFLGALLGVFSGLAVNHAWSKQADHARRTQLKAVLRSAVDHNADLLVMIETVMGKGGFPTFNVDLPLLESTASLKYELLDADLCREIDRLRYELTHLARKVDLLLKLEFDPSAKNVGLALDGSGETSEYMQLRPKLVGAIIAHIAPINTMIANLQARLPKPDG